MRVFITGATGFIGRHLVKHLLRQGHKVTAWVRSPKDATRALGHSVQLMSINSSKYTLARTLSDVDAVVNLAGASLFARRWSQSFKETLVRSRVELTSRVVDAIIEADPAPRVLLSASGVGYYGDRGDEVLSESSGPGVGFLSELSSQWEETAARAEAAGTRVVQLRIGTVLGTGGGALERLVPLYRKGLGGRLGSGSQYMSWIHIDDLVRVILACLTDPSYSGPVNAVAPESSTNMTFTRSLAAALGRHAVLHAPAAMLRAMVGQAATVLLASQRVRPRKLQDLGFRFRYTALDEALAAVLSAQRPESPVRIWPRGHYRTTAK